MAEARIGVYICHCGVNISKTVDVKAVAEFVKTLPNVVIARDYLYMCSDPGQDLIKKDIEEYNLNRIVVAACSPRMHEPTFRGCIFEVGLNPYLFEMANIREHCSWVHGDKKEATEKTKDLVKSAVMRAIFLEPLLPKETPVTKSALVIGGGIAGIQAALDIADAGYKVYLVEKDPSIGGRMAQLEKTFPTLDCAACILTPKMVDVARNKNIELFAYSEIEDISGSIGNFKVKIKKKARYVNWDLCTGCEICMEKCPKRVKSEFNLKLDERKVIYKLFPQATPNKVVIDAPNCLYLTKGACRLCEKVCPFGAIDFKAKDEFLEVDVGAIILATGYEEFDPGLKPEFGFEKYPEVITGLQAERILSASGPTNGEFIINGKKPKDITFIHCVGSRDKQIGNEYCSRVCCMYIAKQAHLVKERIPDAQVNVFYMDVRAFGKGFEEFYDRVKQEGIIYRRGNPSEIYREGEKLIVRVEDTLLGEVVEHKTDCVVLGTGLVPSATSKKMATILKLSLSPDRFFLEAHPKLRPVDSNIDGIYLAGVCQGPKDIPDAVAQAKGAAASVIALLNKDMITVEPIVAEIKEEQCSGCHICEGLCPYQALIFNPEKKVMEVETILCKGCGACVAACPSGAITLRHYTKAQTYAQISALA